MPDHLCWAQCAALPHIRDAARVEAAQVVARRWLSVSFRLGQDEVDRSEPCSITQKPSATSTIPT